MSMSHNTDRTGSTLSRRVRDEDGQTLGEYGVLIGFIAILVVAAAVLLEGTIFGLFNQAIGVF